MGNYCPICGNIAGKPSKENINIRRLYGLEVKLKLFNEMIVEGILVKTSKHDIILKVGLSDKLIPKRDIKLYAIKIDEYWFERRDLI